jgi:hypothetical protein
MAYKVELPPDIRNFAKEPETSGGLSLPKITGYSGYTGDGVTEGRIRAVEICSEILEDHIWLALDPGFAPGDSQAVYYPEELPILGTKTPEQLREIHKAKLALGPGMRVRE